MTEPTPASGEQPAPPDAPGRVMDVLKRSRKLSTTFVAVLAILIGVPAFVVLLPIFNEDLVKGPPYIAGMKSDLRNLVTAEESYFADHLLYTTSTAAINFTPDRSVTVTIGVVTTTGWNATARHAGLGSMVCGIFVGTAPPPIAGALEGEPMCEKRSRD